MRKEAKNLNRLLGNIKSSDPFFLQLSGAIVALGLYFAITISTSESLRLTGGFWSIGIKQTFSFIIGIILLIFFWLINYKTWFKFSWYIAISALLLMILTVFTSLGKTVGGSQRWIDFGFIQFQSSELAKFAVILITAKQLTLYRWYEKKAYYYLGYSFLILIIILKQPDLGTTLLLLFLIGQMLFISGWPIWLLGICGAIGCYGAYLKILSTPYQWDRLKFWLNPYLEPLGRGYNYIQSEYALGLGGIFGVGIGNSTQKQGYLPVAHSDFIFSIIGEEIGFIGLSVIFTLFITWFLRGMFLLSKSDDLFGYIFGVGILTSITTQSIMNMSVSTGLMPITGVTLPFFSCGGTSLIVTFIMCGILLNIISSNKKDLILKR